MNQLNKAILACSVLLITMIGCQKRVASNDTSVASAEAEEMGGAAQLEETRIIGKIINRSIDADRFVGDLHPCDHAPCEALVEVLSVSQIGSDFHGQFEAGHEIDVHFDFTLEDTEEYFPELNIPLPGLEEGDFFSAPIFTSSTTDSPDKYRIKMYELQK